MKKFDVELFQEITGTSKHMRPSKSIISQTISFTAKDKKDLEKQIQDFVYKKEMKITKVSICAHA